MKKLWLTLAAAAAALGTLPLVAAFEAHVINVTAEIENALAVQTEDISFGTVFPQEFLTHSLRVELAESFRSEDRVDGVRYVIRQKPKCGLTVDGGETLVGPTATGHVIADPQAPDGYRVDCGPRPEGAPPEATWDVLPSLCPYLSKHPDGVDDLGRPQGDDGTTPSFHHPFTVAGDVVQWLDTVGQLSKDGGDTVDNWLIDLSVPCFGGECAQDWDDFVLATNDQAGDPDQWTQLKENEHKIFGCDLWVEVTGVAEGAPAPG
jgi:hypothetical protein